MSTSVKKKSLTFEPVQDMLSYERDSMELDDLLQEIDAEIRELHQKIWKTA